LAVVVAVAVASALEVFSAAAATMKGHGQ